ERQFLDWLLADLGKTFGRQGISGEVGDDRRQVADAPFGIQDSGLFTAARAEADKLHCSALSGLAGEWITEPLDQGALGARTKTPAPRIPSMRASRREAKQLDAQLHAAHAYGHGSSAAPTKDCRAVSWRATPPHRNVAPKQRP